MSSVYRHGRLLLFQQQSCKQHKQVQTSPHAPRVQEIGADYPRLKVFEKKFEVEIFYKKIESTSP
jgi:hypothetical protein